MKSILIIGMGRFGHHLCENLAMLGNDVMVVDQKEEVLEDLLPIVTSAKIGDCTNEAVLRSLGIANFDICFVCIGTNFQSSLEITSLVKELAAAVSSARRTATFTPSSFSETVRTRSSIRTVILQKRWRSATAPTTYLTTLN